MNIASRLPGSAGAMIFAFAAALLPCSAGAQNSASQSSWTTVNEPTIRTTGGGVSTQAFYTASEGNRPEWMNAPKLNLVISGGNIVEDGKKLAPATVASVLEYVGKREPNFSYILTPGVGNIEVADMVLHNVRITDLPRALLQASDAGLTAAFDRSSSAPILQVSVPSVQRIVVAFNLSNYLGLENAAKTTTADMGVPAPTPNPPPTAADVRAKLESVKDLILKTVRDVDDKRGTMSKSLSFEYHEGSGVLVAIGTGPAIAIVSQVVNALDPQNGQPTLKRAAVAVQNAAQDALSARMLELAKYLDAAAKDKAGASQMDIDSVRKMLEDYTQRLDREEASNPFGSPPQSNSNSGSTTYPSR